jgi:hypothetical protein
MTADGGEVMNYLLPDGGWVITEKDFDSIIYDEGVTPISKTAFNKAVDEIETIIANRKTTKEVQKAALLAKLGISESEAALLLS